MPITTVFVSGPRQAGKSTVAQILQREVLGDPIHWVRLYPSETNGHTSAVRLADAAEHAGMASVQYVGYTPDRVFEVLPEALIRVRRKHRYATVVIEADADPCLRHAYPYDHRIFVMPKLADLACVFRSPAEASVSLMQVMEDTAEFASEMFGLFPGESWDDAEGVCHQSHVRTAGGVEERMEVAEGHMGRFFTSPLGAEIAARVQLQPEYHAVVESDVVLVNTPSGAASPHAEACVDRIRSVLARIRTTAKRESALYCCDLLCGDDPARVQFLERLRGLFAA
ncbi:MAG: hypothetical protein JXA69_02805 [Phycisphaerae bacterium]|nr:hypothetical protein [Phycisphaerae bacterium]